MSSFRLQARASTTDDGRSHEDLGQQLNIAFWLLTTLATLFLGLRVYCKAIRVRSLWWDDYLLIAAWVWQSPFAPQIEATKLTCNLTTGLPRDLGRNHVRLRCP